jgi:hypothetical protein
MWKIIDLHGRCASYVMDCFHSHELFDEVCQLISPHFISLLQKWCLTLNFNYHRQLKKLLRNSVTSVPLAFRMLSYWPLSVTIF